MRDAVSLVDGYNLPVRIDNNKGCGVADCPVDLGPNCTQHFSPPVCKRWADSLMVHCAQAPTRLKAPSTPLDSPLAVRAHVQQVLVIRVSAP